MIEQPANTSPDATRHANAALRTPLTRRRWLAATATATAAAALARATTRALQATPHAATPTPSQPWRGQQWVGSWARGMHVPHRGTGDDSANQIFALEGTTLRQIVRFSTGGEQVRIRLSNIAGDGQIFIGAASVALRDHDAVIDPATLRRVTFSGLPEATIPAHAIILSDPVDLPVANLAELAISLSFPAETTSSTVHGEAFQTNYLSSAGDQTMVTDFPVESTMQSWVFLTGVDVQVMEPRGAIVCLGDSITDGVNSTPDTNHRWPDLLADRLAAAGAAMPGVLNLGIAGNRVLRDAPDGYANLGPGALARFDRDVVAQPGASHVIVLLGINDIALPGYTGFADEDVTAEQLIAGLRQVAERAHEHGLVAYGATITPYGDSDFYTPQGEAIRTAVNDWIRQGGAFDAVIDFDAVVRDPAQPSRHLPAYDGGDFLHFNDTGFQAMAGSIDLSLFGVS
ncbi:MAG: SGNH/GDSL hydrolase family protein [Thermomicrobiales bacterium]